MTRNGYLLIPDGKGPFPAVVVVYYVYRSIRDSAYGLGAAASYVVAGGLLILTVGAALGARWRRAARA